MPHYFSGSINDLLLACETTRGFVCFVCFALNSCGLSLFVLLLIHVD